MDFSGVSTTNAMCLFGKADVGWLWHRRLVHVNMRTLQSLHKGGHILGLKDHVSFAKDHICRACIEGKMHDMHHKRKTIISSKGIFSSSMLISLEPFMMKASVGINIVW